MARNLALPEVRERLQDLGFHVTPATPEEQESTSALSAQWQVDAPSIAAGQVHRFGEVHVIDGVGE